MTNIATVTSGFEQIGDTCFLIRLVDLNRGTTSYRISAEPGHANMSREARVDGWLGTTNDIAAYAEGRVVLTGWIGDEGRVRFQRV